MIQTVNAILFFPLTFQLKEGGKTSTIQSFKDPVISTGLPVIDLVDVIQPGSIDYELVTPGVTPEVRSLIISQLSFLLFIFFFF